MAENNQKYRKYAKNGTCQICNFDRYVEVCHLVPKRIGGGHSDDNILLLCPNHHSLLDCGLLNREELAKIEVMIINATNIYKDDTHVLDYLYFLLRLKNNAPKWMDKSRKQWKEKESNAY